MAVNNDGSCFQVFTRDTKSKVISGASGASVIAGIIIIGLGALALFGPLGSPGFAGSMAGGGVLVIGGALGIIIIAVKNPRNTVRVNDTVRVNGEDYELTFFNYKNQERAKQVFTEKMGGEQNVSFPKPCRVDKFEGLEGVLVQDIFKYATTTGVENDIPRSSRDPNNLHIYQIASQYNAAEAIRRYTPGIGRAMEESVNDYSQGPKAQRTNPEAFENVTAFLTHLGFNMLNGVLGEEATTFAEGSVVQHGYLCPTDENINGVTQAFMDNYEHTEYVCYKSRSDAWQGAVNPVYIMLQAAPAIGYSLGLSVNSNELQKYAALANYLALFQEGIRIAVETDKPVVIHVAAVGLGVFKNAEANFLWGFKKAALHFQDQMAQNKVKVQLECLDGESSHLCPIAKALHILPGKRIGD